MAKTITRLTRTQDEGGESFTGEGKGRLGLLAVSVLVLVRCGGTVYLSVWCFRSLTSRPVYPTTVAESLAFFIVTEKVKEC